MHKLIIVLSLISISTARPMEDLGLQAKGANEYHIPSIMSSALEDSYVDAAAAGYDNSLGGYDFPQQKPIIHKHIYVHVPPASIEKDDEHPRIRSKPFTPQKHYKIIFIKAPSQSIRPILPAVSSHEEKTLIYVLHKKPEIGDIVLPTAPPTQPSKPEVYFIKYKAKTEEKPIYGPPPNDIMHEKTTTLDPIVPEDISMQYRSTLE
ncbi:hypothetical protein ACFFRR_009589 [Megaselia abdita]